MTPAEGGKQEWNKAEGRKGEVYSLQGTASSLFEAEQCCVSKAQLQQCWVAVLEYNSQSPDEGTLDLDIWEKVKQNILKADRKDEHILVQFWITWVLV